MTQAEQAEVVATNLESGRKPKEKVAKDAQYWEKKVADAMRRVSQRLAAA